jgi:hypothetical protein
MSCRASPGSSRLQIHTPSRRLSGCRNLANQARCTLILSSILTDQCAFPATQPYPAQNPGLRPGNFAWVIGCLSGMEVAG